MFFGSILSQRHSAPSGTAMILVLSLITLITIELTTMSLVLTKGIGDEALLMNQNVVARQITETASTQMDAQIVSTINYLGYSSDDLKNTATINTLSGYLKQNGGYDIRNRTITMNDPETGQPLTMKNVTYSAWVSTARPPYYLVNIISNVGSVQLSSKRWILSQPCTNNYGNVLGKGYFSSKNPDYNARAYYPWTTVNYVDTSVAPSYSVYDSVNGWVVSGSRDVLELWSSATGVSTLYSAKENYPGGYGGILVDGARQRVFFLNANYYKKDSGLMMWTPSGGLSTLIANGTLTYGGANTPQSMALDAKSGRVYIGAGVKGAEAAPLEPTDGFYAWDDVNGTQTIIAPHGSKDGEGTRSTIVDPTGRVYFGSHTTKGNFYTWHPSTGLSTLLSNEYYPGVGSLTVDSTSGIVYVAIYPSTGSGAFANGALLGYKNGRRIIRVDFPNKQAIGIESIAVDPKRQRVFMGTADASQKGYFYIWNPATGLSQLDNDQGKQFTNAGSFLVDDTTGRVYFGNTFGSETFLNQDMYNSGLVGSLNGADYFSWTPGDSTAKRLFTSDSNCYGLGSNNAAKLDTQRQILAVGGPPDCNFIIYSPSRGVLYQKALGSGYSSPAFGDNGNIAIDPATGSVYLSSSSSDQGGEYPNESLFRFNPPNYNALDYVYTEGVNFYHRNYGSATLFWDSLSGNLVIPNTYLDSSYYGGTTQSGVVTYLSYSSTCDRNF